MGQTLNTAQAHMEKKGKKEILKSRAQQLSIRDEKPHTRSRNKEIQRAPPRSFAVLPLLGHMEAYLNKQ